MTCHTMGIHDWRFTQRKGCGLGTGSRLPGSARRARIPYLDGLAFADSGELAFVAVGEDFSAAV